MTVQNSSRVAALRNIATRLRIDSIRATSTAGSGHPSTCCSAAEIVSALFFSEMRYDANDPQHPYSDRFVLSKGHAAPLLYAVWAEAGLIPRDELLKLRTIESNLEGHPTPRLSFVDVATGSLGQGLCAGVGIALNARHINSDYRTYVLLGDGETAEGSVWEAAQVASKEKLSSLCGIIDVNRFGQSGPTLWQHDMDALAVRWESFGWHTTIVDGHDVLAILEALDSARHIKDQPSMILAKTLKGKGVAVMEGKPGWHGKPLKLGEETDRAIEELKGQLVSEDEAASVSALSVKRPATLGSVPTISLPEYTIGQSVATRQAYGEAIAKLGMEDSRIVALDADVKNSTFSEKFEQRVGDRFHQNYIAEQVMIGAAMGLASRGAIPFPSTFAAFLTRAHDFIRMAAISNLNIKMAGSHAGVSIGEDGPSQMALEDLAMMRAQPNILVFYPCDATSTEKLVSLMAGHEGPVYMRTSRPKTSVIYSPDETFHIGGLKILRESDRDVATVIGAGVTVFEALTAYEQLQAEGISIRVVDLYSVQPVDQETLIRCGQSTKGSLITVEDHYINGGIGDAVASAVASAGLTVRRLAICEIPRSGKPAELLDRYGISAKHIVAAVKSH
tara:strand:+ start:5901 stop:7754 length:1854 start_codon:yes stop_codon:yes gene_type:complete